MTKVFISWSGTRANTIALALRDWLPQVIQELDPWVSSLDIPKGKSWLTEITQRLDGTSEGIICVTPENVESQWLNFEAGTLAKNATESSVRTVLFDMSSTQVTGPLSNFQHTALSEKADMFLLIESINDKCSRPLKASGLELSFDRAWPDLQERLAKIPPLPSGTPPPERSELDLLEEVLDRVRNLERNTYQSNRMLPGPVLRGDAEHLAARQRALLQLAERLEEEQRIDDRYRVIDGFAYSKVPGGEITPVDLNELQRHDPEAFRRLVKLRGANVRGEPPAPDPDPDPDPL